jgi:hypothetical protein
MIEHDRLRAFETAARLTMEDFEQPVERIVELLRRERQALLDDIDRWLEGEAQKFLAKTPRWSIA